MIYHTRIPAGAVPRTWLGRLAAALIATSLAITGLFFMAFAVVAATLIAAVVIVRIWWVSRKLRAQRDAGVIEGSYSVEIESAPTLPSGDTESAATRRESR